VPLAVIAEAVLIVEVGLVGVGWLVGIVVQQLLPGDQTQGQGLQRPDDVVDGDDAVLPAEDALPVEVAPIVQHTIAHVGHADTEKLVVAAAVIKRL